MSGMHLEKGRALRWTDPAAVGVSLACLAHCLLVPLLLSIAPWAVPGLWQDETFHLWAVAAAIPLSAVGIGLGFRQHRRIGLVLLAGAGLTGMLAGALLAPDEATETAATVVGASAVALAHLRNYSLGRTRS
jgi:hypothetical protein